MHSVFGLQCSRILVEALRASALETLQARIAITLARQGTELDPNARRQRCRLVTKRLEHCRGLNAIIFILPMNCQIHRYHVSASGETDPGEFMARSYGTR